MPASPSCRSPRRPSQNSRLWAIAAPCCRESAYPKLPHDVLSLDFSGWTVFVHAEADDALVTQICAGLDARKARIPWEEPGHLPVERMAREALDTPQCVPLHPAAERFWRSRGYL